MKKNSKITAEAVEILVKSINIDKMLGIGAATSDMDYPTTKYEIAQAFAFSAAFLGLRASTEQRLRTLYPAYDSDRLELTADKALNYGVTGVNMSSVLHPNAGDCRIRIVWSLHILPDTDEWLVVVDAVDEWRLQSDEDLHKGLADLGFTF